MTAGISGPIAVVRLLALVAFPALLAVALAQVPGQARSARALSSLNPGRALQSEQVALSDVHPPKIVPEPRRGAGQQHAEETTLLVLAV
jgi:hypothetical protein